MCGRYGYSKRALARIAEKMRLPVDAAMQELMERFREKRNHAPTLPGPVVRIPEADRSVRAPLAGGGLSADRSVRAPLAEGGLRTDRGVRASLAGGGLSGDRVVHAPLAEAEGTSLAGGPARAEMLRWGFAGMPRADGGPAPFHINARCETVARLPAFRDSWAHRRCLVIADWFYEWDQQTRPKQPWRFVLEDEEPMVMAGFWKPTTLKDGQTVDAYAIVTTAANATVGRIHDRMPVLLPEADWQAWLDPATPPDRLKALQHPFDGRMFARPVDIRLNKASYDGAVEDITLPEPPPQQQQLSL